MMLFHARIRNLTLADTWENVKRKSQRFVGRFSGPISVCLVFRPVLMVEKEDAECPKNMI